MSQHLEDKAVIANEQWGFRPYRSAIDALFVMSRVLADAAGVIDHDPIVFDLMDIQKAYPNCSRNAMEASLKMAGIPAGMRNLTMQMVALTSYRCRSAVGLSDGYTNQRGTREGCPAAPVKFKKKELPCNGPG